MLARYQVDTARLLRDRSNLITPLSELTDYINEGRRLVARISGCINVKVFGNAPFGTGSTPSLLTPGAGVPGRPDTTITVFQTTPGVETYDFRWASRFLQAQNAGVQSIIDVISVAVSWGTPSSSARPVMEWYSWDDLQALARIYSAGVFTYPFAAAKSGNGAGQQLWLFPVPGQALEMEWDCFCIPKPLFADSDYEAIQEPFTEAVKFAAAWRAFMTTQRWGSSELMLNMLTEHLGVDRASVDSGLIPSYYDI